MKMCKKNPMLLKSFKNIGPLKGRPEYALLMMATLNIEKGRHILCYMLIALLIPIHGM